MKILLLAALAVSVAHAKEDGEHWYFVQVTQTSVDSGAFITQGQAGHPEVTTHQFASRELCDKGRIALASLQYGIDQPMGTGSYFARIGAWLSECIQRN